MGEIYDRWTANAILHILKLLFFLNEAFSLLSTFLYFLCFYADFLCPAIGFATILLKAWWIDECSFLLWAIWEVLQMFRKKENHEKIWVLQSGSQVFLPLHYATPSFFNILIKLL